MEIGQGVGTQDKNIATLCKEPEISTAKEFAKLAIVRIFSSLKKISLRPPQNNFTFFIKILLWWGLVAPVYNSKCAA